MLSTLKACFYAFVFCISLGLLFIGDIIMPLVVMDG